MRTPTVHDDEGAGAGPVTQRQPASAGLLRCIAARMRYEARESVASTLFVFAGFNSIVLTSTRSNALAFGRILDALSARSTTCFAS
jgi:hypothetical protein